MVGSLSVLSDNRDLPVLWNRMPSILREKTGRVKRSASSTTGPKAKLRKLDPSKVLARLENKEKETDGDEDEEGNFFFLNLCISLAKFFMISFDCRGQERW